MSSRLIVEKILPLEELETLCSSEDWAASLEFSSLKRRCEWLSWRVYLRRELGSDIRLAYNNLGAPYIVDSELFLSISHTRTHVAILLSHSACAVDIESLTRNFGSVKSRFISSVEEYLLPLAPHSMALIWCAKEAAYKYAATSPLDFLRDIEVQAIDCDANTITMRIKDRVVRAAFSLCESYAIVTI